jgi:cephalosporin-C deacetylase-like acetyl esterase
MAPMTRVPLAMLLASAACLAQPDDARQKLIATLNQIGLRQAKERAVEVARIQTPADAERRRRDVRSKITALIGPVPESGRPVAVREFGVVRGEGFRVEKIAYESLPGLWVTANVYVPSTGPAPYPAVLLTPGHEPTGKLGQYTWGANLANNGILAMAVDPMGQGERLQHYDPELEASKVGQGTGEHGMAAFSTLLMGAHVAHYFLNDAMRGVDYLSHRPDVNAAHIGAFGCSGGGTATAYLSALDPRVKVAVTACYITSFEALLPTAGPQEAEQTIPHFLEQGLDFGDWVELAAPKPYAIVSTESDMFPFAGARQTYEEAKRIWTLYGAEDRLQWIHGPGGHGNLGPISPQILAFLTRWLKDDPKPPEFRQFKPMRREELLCTPTGQISTSIGGETVESINRKLAQPILAAAAHRPARAGDIRAIAGIGIEPGKTLLSVDVVKTEQHEGYRVETISLGGSVGAGTAGLVAIPEGTGRKPAVLWLDSAPKETLAARPDFERLAKSGHVVAILQPRGSPGPTTGVQSPLLGAFNLIALRAMLVGRTLVGMRVEDTIHAIDWLTSRPDVDPASITVYGNGAMGVVALHAAALDKRINHVVVENTSMSYRRAIEQPLHHNLPEIALPGVLRAYDLGDLVLAIAPAPVTIANPVDAMEQPVSEEVFRKELSYVFPGGTVRLVSRSFRDPLPIE